ncbi:MAG: hypothetical protein JNL26_17130, partial [Gemmatimonadetes bacterium]|nr:hypothetical protein [Gemmatimonadota bacterium]
MTLPVSTPAGPGGTSSGPTEVKLPRSFVSRAGMTTPDRDVNLKEMAAALADPSATLWVDIDSTNRSQFALLEKLFGFHPLAIEDVLNPVSRPKVDQYDHYLFVTLRV